MRQQPYSPMSKQLGEDRFICKYSLVFIKDSVSPIHQVDYDANGYHDGLYDEFGIRRPVGLLKWVPQRQAQFLAGRLAAKQALTSHKTTLAESQIAIGNHREPIWPTGCTGSISHSEQTSVACVNQQLTERGGVGVDIQSNINKDTINKIASTVLSEKDSLIMKRGVADLTESQLFTLLFSAKESVFKALFNTVGEYFDFQTVSVENIDFDLQQVTIKTTIALTKEIPEGTEINVSFLEMIIRTPRIITMCHWNYRA